MLPRMAEWQEIGRDLQPNRNPNKDQSLKSGFIFGQELGIIKSYGSKSDESQRSREMVNNKEGGVGFVIVGRRWKVW